MYKPIYYIGTGNTIKTSKRLRSGVMISFFALSSISTSVAKDNQFTYLIEDDLKPITAVTAKNFVSGEIIPDAIEIFANNILSTSDKTFISFEKLTMNHSEEAANMEPVVRFIAEGMGDIIAEKVSVNCDFENEIINVAYRLPNDILLSVSKPLSTMTDTFVMFNLFNKRQLLVSDSASIELLSTYIKKVESRVAKLA